jgi:soluble lytic murein transglycosylase
MSRLSIVLLALAMAAPAHATRKKAKKPPAAPKLPPPPPGSVTPEAIALGKGVRALWAGDLPAAKKELTPLVGPKSKLRNLDHAEYALAQAHLLSGDAAAAQPLFDTVARGKSRFAAVALARQADAARLAGHGEAARKLYEAAIARNASDVDNAACRYHLAEVIEAAEEAARAQPKAKAIAAYRKVYVSHPLHPLAERARQRLTELEPSAEITPAERIARAKTMTANRGWPLAIEELKQLPADLTGPLKDEAEYWYGTTLFRMRRQYDVAAEKLLGVWSRLPGDDRKSEALFHGARAKSRADLDDEAIAGYRDLLTKFPHGRNAAEASFLIGWLDFNRGKYKEAIPGLEETLKRYGGSQYGDDARWYLGLSRWLSGDVDGALADFTRVAQLRGDLWGGKGAYWRAMALAKLGRQDEAAAAWQKIARERPFTFYAMLARLRLGERKIELDAFGRAAGERGDKGEAIGAPAGIDATVARDPIVLRADELLGAGLTVEASVELARGDGELMRRFGAQRTLPLLFDRCARGQDFFRMHRLAEAHAGRALAVDPAEAAGARAWWELVYPRAYRDSVERYAPTGENPPYYLYTIMQKESAYNPHDVSYADAIGLLQMIPPTSRKVAEHVGVAYTDDVLYDPDGNIRFGAWYIGHLLHKFKGQIAIGAGSYNAGPKAMMRWLDKNGARSLDEFVELCPYTQTREYMKKALAIYSRYVYLYAHEDYLPSLAVDADYVKDDGVDY